MYDKEVSTPGFDKFMTTVQDQILSPIVTLLALAAFILFAYGVVEFLTGTDNDEKRSTGKRHMLWGVVGLAIIFGAQLIVKVIGNIATGIVGG